MSLKKWIAADFARKAHQDQKRKYTGEPYFIHCKEIVTILQRYVENVTEDMICAAYLHDTIEDTTVTYEDILRTFGKEVADLVLELTDTSKPEDGNRAVRKEIDRQRLAKASPAAQTIKLADLISNSRSIIDRDPDFAKIYLAEKDRLLEVLTSGDKLLMRMATDILKRGKVANE